MKRNNGLSLLRIISMCGIIGLHLINNGGVINNLNLYSFKFFCILIVTTFFYTSVNVFALLTGYLNVNKSNNKYYRIIELISVSVFYCFFISIIFYSFNLFNIRSFGKKELIISLFPVLVGRYWYLTCYVFLFFFIPFLNRFVHKITKNNLKKMLIIGFVLLSVIPNIFGMIDFFKIENGYSPFWLIYLYLVGAYIRLYYDNLNLKNKYIKYIFIILIFTSILNYLSRIISFILFNRIIVAEWFIGYTSPFIIILSILLLLFYKDISIKNVFFTKIIDYFSNGSFSVYIIHSQKLIFDYVLHNCMLWLINYNVLFCVIIIFIFIFIIYIMCLLIDCIRVIIYKIFLIDKINEKIGYLFSKLINFEESDFND